MSRQVQLRRGTAVQHETFTGLVGELTMNTTNNTLRLHDNVTVGGHEMLKADMSNVLIGNASTFSLLDNLGQVSIRITNVANPVDDQDVATKSWVLDNAISGSINNLSDVDTSTTPPNNGQVLAWDGNNWIPSNSSIGELVDVNIGGILVGQFIKWDGNEFVPVSLSLADISNANTLATQTELDTTQASVGLDANGDLPNYISTHYIQNGDTHHTALGKLDVQANNNHSDIIDIANALAGKLESVDFNATNIKLIVNADNVGLNADTVDGVHGTNITTLDGNQIVTGSKDFTGNIDFTGSQSVLVNTNLNANNTEVANASFVLNKIENLNLDSLSDVAIIDPQNKEVLIHNGAGLFINAQLEVADLIDGNTLATTITTTAIQNELNNTQTSVGLNGDGSLPVYISTHYIADNDSHHLSLGNLDNALANTDATLAGLTVTVGTKLPSADFNATNIKNLVNADNNGLNADLLDGSHKTDFVLVSSLDSNGGNIPTLQDGKIKVAQIPSIAIVDVSTGLFANIPDPDPNNEGDVYITTDTNQTFISTGADWIELLNPDGALLTAIQNELDITQTSLGLNGDGSKPVYDHNNYIGVNDSHHTAIAKLDAQIKLNTNSLEILGTASLFDDTDFFKVANPFNEISADPNAKITARSNLGLGDVATLNVGTNNENVVQLGANGLPAVSGENLTTLPSIDKLSDVDTTTTPPNNGQVLAWDNIGQKWKPENMVSYTDEEARNAVGNALAIGVHTNGVVFTNNDGADRIDLTISLASNQLTDGNNISLLNVNQTFTGDKTFTGNVDFTGSASVLVTTPQNAQDGEIASASFVRSLVANAGGVTVLTDLDDVEITVAQLNAGQTLRYDGIGNFVNTKLAIGDLSNVDLTENANGKTLIWDGINNKFISSDFPTTYTDADAIDAVGQNLVANNLDHNNITFSLIGGQITADVQIPLNNVTGVTITNPVGIHEVLKYNNAGAFVNAQLSTSDLSDGGDLLTVNDLNVVNGIATLDGNGKLLTSQLPNLAITDVSTGLLADIPNADANNKGDVYITTNTNQTFISTGAEWLEIETPFASVVNAVQSELDTTQTTLGDYIDANGDWIQPVGTNYLNATTTFSNAISTLDTEIKTNSDNIGLKLNTADFTNATIKAKIAEDITGLDADTVDGVHGTNITTLDGVQTITGNKTFTGLTTFSGSTTKITGMNSSFEVESANDNQTKFFINANNGDTTIQGALIVNGTTTLGIATATTPDLNEDSTRIATTEWVLDKIGGGGVGLGDNNVWTGTNSFTNDVTIGGGTLTFAVQHWFLPNQNIFAINNVDLSTTISSDSPNAFRITQSNGVTQLLNVDGNELSITSNVLNLNFKDSMDNPFVHIDTQNKQFDIVDVAENLVFRVDNQGIVSANELSPINAGTLTLSGNVVYTTQPANTNNTTLATTAYVDNAVGAVGGGATTLSQLTDVEIGGGGGVALSGGQTLVYNAGDGIFRNKALELGELNNVSVGNVLIDGQVLRTDGVTWSNTKLSVADLSDQVTLARIESPVFTGNPTAPNQPSGNSTTRIANTAFVQQEINALALGTASQANLGDLLTKAGNLGGLTDKGLARTNLELGDVATLNVGTANGNVVQLDANGLPAVSGVNLIALPSIGLHSDVQIANPTNPQVLKWHNTKWVNTQLASTDLNDSADLARLASPALTGNPTAPTQPANTDDTTIATTEFVQQEISNASIGDLSNVDLTNNANGKVLQYDGAKFVPVALSNTNISGLGTASTYGVGTGVDQVLKFDVANTLPNNISGVNLTALPSISKHSDVDLNTNTITEGQLLSWDDTANKFVARSVGDLSNVVLDNRNTTFSAELRATTQANNDDSTLVATTAFVQNVLSGAGLNPNDFFQLVNLFSEIAGNAVNQAIARTNLGLGSASTYDVSTNTANTIPLLNDQGRLMDCIDYGFVSVPYNPNSDFTIDYQNSGIDGETPLNAEELFQEVVVYAEEDYGCLIS